jgi:hypothetical protein
VLAVALEPLSAGEAEHVSAHRRHVLRVSARLRGNKNDLALLLREVEAYVADSGLRAIRYRVDGRAYIMEVLARETAAAA